MASTGIRGFNFSRLSVSFDALHLVIVAELNSAVLELVLLLSTWLWVFDQMAIPHFEILP